MRKVFGALALVSLVGCASSAMNEARTAGVTKTFSSVKAEQVVAQCIQFSWQDEAVFDVDAAAYLKPGATGGFTVYTRSGEYFADVKGVGGQTSVAYYVSKTDKTAPRRLAALATCL